MLHSRPIDVRKDLGEERKQERVEAPGQSFMELSFLGQHVLLIPPSVESDGCNPLLFLFAQ